MDRKGGGPESLPSRRRMDGHGAGKNVGAIGHEKGEKRKGEPYVYSLLRGEGERTSNRILKKETNKDLYPRYREEREEKKAGIFSPGKGKGEAGRKGGALPSLLTREKKKNLSATSPS